MFGQKMRKKSSGKSEDEVEKRGKANKERNRGERRKLEHVGKKKVGGKIVTWENMIEE